MKLSRAIAMLAECADGNERLAADAPTREYQKRYLGAADGFRRAIEILKLVDEIDKPTSGEGEPASVWMNARRVSLSGISVLNYDAVVILALGNDRRPGVIYTVTVQYDGKGWLMVPGDETEVHDGMVFSVADTSGA